jgi:hypothetical protein
MTLIFSINSSRKRWNLDGNELHKLASHTVLGQTKYRHWTGIVEAVAHLEHLNGIPEPLPDPHDLVPHIHKLEASEWPMLEYNRLFKAIWEFIKSIRVFMRCAAIHQRSSLPHAEYSHFWIQCPLLRPSVYSVVSGIMKDFFGVKCWAIDRYGTHPPRNIPNEPAPLETVTRFGFFANLLCEGAGASSFDCQRDLLLDIYSYMFGGDQSADIFASLIEAGELVDPPMVSYGFAIAREHQELGTRSSTPGISAFAPLMGTELEQINEDEPCK